MTLPFTTSELVPPLIVGTAMMFGLIFGGRRRKAVAPVTQGFDSHFFDQMRDPALVTEGGRVVQANPAAAEQFGYGSEAMIGLPVAQLLADPDDEARFVKALRHGSVTDYELQLRTASGDFLDCLVTATARLNEQGQIVGCRGFARNVTEKKRIIAELRRAQEDYRGLFEHAHDAILILDPVDESVMDANEQACILYDFPRHEFIGRSMIDLSVTPHRGKSLIRRTREGSGRYATFESRQMRRDGTVISVEINAAELTYKGRRVILSINRDVSARRKAEQAVRESEERFRLLLASVIDYSIVMLDPHGVIVSWNEGAQRITGYSEAEARGRRATMFSPPDEQEILLGQLALAVIDGPVERVMTRVRKDGSSFTASVTITSIIDAAGALRGYAEVTHDITLNVQLEKTREDIVAVLRGVANEWTETFDAVPHPIVVLDEDGGIRRLNRMAQVLAGAGFAELIHRQASSLPGAVWQGIARLARRALGTGEPQSERVTDGEAVWQVSATLGQSLQETRRAIVVAHDLTLVTKLEASVRQHEVAAMLGSLVAGVAHEVRNPLFTISATLDAWEARYGRSDGIERYAGILREQVDHLNRLMRDLLEYGKPNPLSLRDASLADVIHAAAADCAAVAEQHGVDIELDLAPLPPIALDPRRMEQVLQNVIDNAVCHSPAGSSVRVEAELGHDGVRCRIIDRGPGIGDEDPEHLFMPFVTRRRGGTGLGLSIARRIVTAHRGTITLENGNQCGAIVSVRLPLRSAETVHSLTHRASDGTVELEDSA